MRSAKQLLLSFGIAGYFFLTVFGLLALSATHQHNMSSMDNCPFMTGEQALCPMNLAEHLSAWKALNNVPTVGTMILVVPLFLILFFFYLRPSNLARSKLHIKPLRESYMTSLFSQGILNSKAP